MVSVNSICAGKKDVPPAGKNVSWGVASAEGKRALEIIPEKISEKIPEKMNGNERKSI
ncbi:MAG TPA: hypothetical protein H9744_06660 [Candidatus Eisenbergiella stercoravium]|nr:hypothetical protein [Candidatus Eisenbergiella stercoravium]